MAEKQKIDPKEEESEIVILTGAGFSKSFGLPLTCELKEKLLSHSLLKSDLIISDQLKGEKNFEEIYTFLLKEYGPNDEKTMRYCKVVVEIFKEFSDLNNFGYLKKNFCKDFIAPLCTKQKRVDFFTLNQDFLIEEFFHGLSDVKLFLSGVNHYCNPKKEDDTDIEYGDHTKDINLANINFQKVYSRQLDRTFDGEDKNKLFYWKLHGSIKWKDNEKPLLIFGSDKDYDEFEICNFYFQKFKKLIKNKKLLIIGYRFRDEHINTVIYESCFKYHTQVYLIDPNASIQNKEASVGNTPWFRNKKFESFLDYGENTKYGNNKSQLKELLIALNIE